MSVPVSLIYAYSYAGVWYAIYQGHTYRIINSTMATATLAPLPVR